jgi:hypothetical protein
MISREEKKQDRLRAAVLTGGVTPEDLEKRGRFAG